MAKGLLSENRPIPTDSPIHDFHLLAYLVCFYSGRGQFYRLHQFFYVFDSELFNVDAPKIQNASRFKCSVFRHTFEPCFLSLI